MKKLLLLLFTSLILSCDNNVEILQNLNYAEFLIENGIDTDIDFMPIEKFISNEVQEPSLFLKITSTEIFNCSNYTFSTTEFVRDTEFIIRLDEVFIPNICLTSLGPATSFIGLPTHVKKLTFINGKQIDSYTITIDSEKVSIGLIENNFTNSLHDKTFRFPENSFAFVCGTNTDNTNLYTDFLTILRQNTNLKEFQFQGEGKIPYPETSSGNWVNHPSIFFTYTDSEGFRNLGQVLNDFSAQNIEKNSGVTISIYSWNTISYHSWLIN